mmetsp:Transcript_34288/g.24795  ORF Transcript_34288/g.24795 Transcript_34288/m.24795 type:complete len:108 (+) Transcript_34288:227-550(+)
MPDSGDGRYSEKLPHAQWAEFNSRNRAHMNFVEFLPIYVITLLSGGFVFPMWSMIFGYILVAARLVYMISYVSCGPSARIPASAISNFGTLALVIGSIVQCVRIAVQ